MRKTVTVGELEFGMYVAELDRPWTDTPFTFQGFVLQTEAQLETLKKYCKVVHVDPDRSEVLARLRQKLPPSASKSAVNLSRTGNFSWPELAPVEQEFKKASTTHATGEKSVREGIEALRAGKTLDAASVQEAVNGVTESVLRNPDALLLYGRLQEKGDYTQSHALDVSVYMTAFGRFLEMPREDIVLLAHLGLLQDIGKMKLPTTLITKRERLTPEEFELAKKHVAYSAEILRATPGLPANLPELAMLHHERHDALTARRPYAEPMAPSAALNMLYKWRGEFFDAYLVEQFIRCIGIFPVGSVVELNSGEVAIVIAQNLVKRLQPRVMVIRDASGAPLKPQKLLDLSRNLNTIDGQPYRIRRTLEYGKIPINTKELFAS